MFFKKTTYNVWIKVYLLSKASTVAHHIEESCLKMSGDFGPICLNPASRTASWERWANIRSSVCWKSTDTSTIPSRLEKHSLAYTTVSVRHTVPSDNYSISEIYLHYVVKKALNLTTIIVQGIKLKYTVYIWTLCMSKYSNSLNFLTNQLIWNTLAQTFRTLTTAINRNWDRLFGDGL